MIEVEFILHLKKIVPFLLISLSLIWVNNLMKYNFIIKSKITIIFYFISNKWFIDSIYNMLINKVIANFAYKTVFILLDKGILEKVQSTGFVFTLNKNLFLLNFNLMQTGVILNYANFLITIFFLLSIIY